MAGAGVSAFPGTLEDMRTGLQGYELIQVQHGNPLLVLIGVGLVVLKVWALVDCATRPGPAFLAHGKLSKQIWLAILVVTVLAGLHFSVLSVLGLAGTIAAIVYLVDVRPALAGTASPW
ncbi:MAG: uncharacterized protein JWO12_1798 [Frankiales bacterium]|nr:uncharacterized protein [Frankiales bacterium]